MQFYCSEHMQNRELNTCKHDIYSFLRFSFPTKPEPIEGLSDQDKNNIIISVHSNIFMTDNPARARLKLFVSRSPEYLKPIIQH